MQLALLALAFAVVAFVLWLSSLSRAKALAARVASLLVENASVGEQLKHVTEQQRRQAKLLEQRVEEVTELKKEIGALKKKNFALQEDAKKTKISLEAKIEERERAMVARPAFEDAPAPKPVVKPVKADAAPQPAAPVVVQPVAAKEDQELLRKIENMARDRDELAAAVAELRKEIREGQGEMRRMKKRVEDYRRADTITKSRTELLNDKLGNLGRQYYDAISELAALKGETQPPRPAEAAPAEEPAEAASAEEAAEATPSLPASEPREGDEVQALSSAVLGAMRTDRAN